MILPHYNGVECFCSIFLDKGLYGLLEYLDDYLQHKPVLVREHTGLKYIHGKHSDTYFTIAPVWSAMYIMRS